MPEMETLAKASLTEIAWGKYQVREKGRRVEVQFNPQTLKVSYSNQKSGGGQSGGGAMQYVGRGATTLSLELLFDATVPAGGGKAVKDVRSLTQQVVYFMLPASARERGKRIPPGVRFAWGSFLFEGVMDSVNETLEFFSSDGLPLRATVAVTLSRQDILYKPPKADAGPGTTPQETAADGDTVHRMAGREGRAEHWPMIAEANGIENPRRLPAVEWA